MAGSQSPAPPKNAQMAATSVEGHVAIAQHQTIVLVGSSSCSPRPSLPITNRQLLAYQVGGHHGFQVRSNRRALSSCTNRAIRLTLVPLRYSKADELGDLLGGLRQAGRSCASLMRR